jgi:Mu transposase-like protein
MAQEGVVTVADQRIHGTTFRKPAEAFDEERLRSHVGRPPYVLQTSMRRTVARDCLVTIETNRYSVPATYGGKHVEVQWGPEGTGHIYHRGRLIARHPRLSGQHQQCVEPRHSQLFHQQPAAPLERRGSPTDLALTAWTGPCPEVMVRQLSVYEALSGQAVGHD